MKYQFHAICLSSPPSYTSAVSLPLAFSISVKCLDISVAKIQKIMIFLNNYEENLFILYRILNWGCLSVSKVDEQWKFSKTLASLYRTARIWFVLIKNALFKPGCPTSCAAAAMYIAANSSWSSSRTSSNLQVLTKKLTVCVTSNAWSRLW